MYHPLLTSAVFPFELCLTNTATCPVFLLLQAMSSLMAENKALLERVNALERVAARAERANGIAAPPSPTQ
jgi:hypothetical protein